MKLLAFELSTEACSVALWVDGDVRGRHEIAPRRHAEFALPWAEALLAEAGVAKSQLDAVAVGRGPGAFTGVRLGVAIAQGIALALDRPAVPVSTLAALALRAVPLGAGLVDTGLVDDRGDRVFAAIDARMREVYVASYARDGSGWRTLREPDVLKPDAVPAQPASSFGAGDGLALYPALAARIGLARHDASLRPTSRAVGELAADRIARGDLVAARDAHPMYVRHRVALTAAERAAGARL